MEGEFQVGAFSPLRQKQYRRIWLASLLSNLAQHVQAVCVAWMMVQLTTDVAMISLVQTAMMLPHVILALPAGAISDTFDRRQIALVALMWTVVSAITLATLTLGHLMTPTVLLLCCLSVGAGLALFVPAWQTSISELVGHQSMAPAITLNSLSMNVARTVGPAVGGLVVATTSAPIGFIVNALLYLPMIAALSLWRRTPRPVERSFEPIHRAVASGIRFASQSGPIKRILARAFGLAFGIGVQTGLMPIIARNVLGGNAMTLGLLLAAFGFGAVSSAFASSWSNQRTGKNRVIHVMSFAQAAALVLIGFSETLLLSLFAAAVSGACWMMLSTFYNVTLQRSAPRWVVGRVVAMFQAVLAVGWSVGAALAGWAATHAGVGAALEIAGGLIFIALIALPSAPKLPEIPKDWENAQEDGSAVMSDISPVP
jgi:MFS family permease